MLHQRLSTLTEKHRRVVFMSFGLEDGVEKTVRTVSKELGMERKEVELLKKEALDVLRIQYKTSEDGSPR